MDPNFLNNNFEIALTNTFLKMDELIRKPEHRKELISFKGTPEEDDLGNGEEDFYSGCTACVALIHQGKYLYVANAGDSRCNLCASNGELIEMSSDHKPDNDLEKTRI